MKSSQIQQHCWNITLVTKKVFEDMLSSTDYYSSTSSISKKGWYE